jgi:NAD(P)-dependent dehydrogenase (short-subunit alcohol dehydrogenase family)
MAAIIGKRMAADKGLTKVALGSRTWAPATLRAAGTPRQHWRTPGRARFVHLDVTDQASITAVAGRIDREQSVLDILVNNAGIVVRPVRSPSQTPVSDMRQTYETNVFGVVAVTNAMLPLLRRSRAGRIVNRRPRPRRPPTKGLTSI